MQRTQPLPWHPKRSSKACSLGCHHQHVLSHLREGGLHVASRHCLETSPVPRWVPCVLSLPSGGSPTHPQWVTSSMAIEGSRPSPITPSAGQQTSLARPLLANPSPHVDIPHPSNSLSAQVMATTRPAAWPERGVQTIPYQPKCWPTAFIGSPLPLPSPQPFIFPTSLKCDFHQTHNFKAHCCYIY